MKTSQMDKAGRENKMAQDLNRRKSLQVSWTQQDEKTKLNRRYSNEWTKQEKKTKSEQKEENKNRTEQKRQRLSAVMKTSQMDKVGRGKGS